MTAEGRVNKVIELIDHEEVNMSNEERVQLKASRRAQISLLDNEICGSVEQCLTAEGSEEMVSEIDISNFYCWTDSQISLAWIRLTNQEFKTFIGNRVNTIRKLVAPKLWNYCKTDENPADIVTRISKHDFIENNLWWERPVFLKNASIENNFSRSNRNT